MTATGGTKLSASIGAREPIALTRGVTSVTARLTKHKQAFHHFATQRAFRHECIVALFVLTHVRIVVQAAVTTGACRRHRCHLCVHAADFIQTAVGDDFSGGRVQLEALQQLHIGRQPHQTFALTNTTQFNIFHNQYN